MALNEWNTEQCNLTETQWFASKGLWSPIESSSEEAGNWFVKATLWAWWNEMTSIVLRRQTEGYGGKKRWPMTHMKINTTWWESRNCATALCSHLGLSHKATVLPQYICDVISKTKTKKNNNPKKHHSDTGHLVLLAICLAMWGFHAAGSK